MTKSKLVSVLPALCFSWLVTGCPDDATESASDTNNDTSSESSDSDPDSTVSVTISTSETMTTTDDTDPTTTMTMTTVDPDSSGTDPTDATESSSSTDPTESSSSTDPTVATESSSGSDSGSSTDPTGATTGTLACVDDDLGNALPVAEAGTTVGAGDDFIPSCPTNDANDEDVAFEWTAPADGTYQFDTFGSDYDTVIALLSDCDGEELACNDDAGDDVQSGFVLDLTEGTTVIVVVDGYNETGNFILNITEILPNMGVAWGDCVNQDVQAGCSVAETNCLVDDLMDPTLGVCTALCDTDDDCSDAPATGEAPVVCGDLGGGTTVCMLDCSADQTCPDGMECVDTFYCAWPVD